MFPSKLARLPLEVPSPSPTAEASTPSPPEELSSSPLGAPSPSPTAKASSPSPREELSSSPLEAPNPSPTAEASSPSPPEVTSPSETSPRPFGVTSPHPPFRPSAVVLKDASTCLFISIEGSTISDLPPMGVLYRFLASPLMPSSYQHRLFVDIGSHQWQPRRRYRTRDRFRSRHNSCYLPLLVCRPGQ